MQQGLSCDVLTWHKALVSKRGGTYIVTPRMLAKVCGTGIKWQAVYGFV